jgi:hypothetical protein
VVGKMVQNTGLERIVRRGLVTLSLAGAIALSGCNFPVRQPLPTRTLPPPQVYVYTHTPQPTLTQTPTPTPTPTPTATPTQACIGEKKIVVDISEQMAYAVIDNPCSGEREFVNASLASTGVAEWPTLINEENDGWDDFRIYTMLESTTMSGPGYYLENVPHTMYFYQGYGVHGAYWHNNFGSPMSHGCVNLPLDMADWFFHDWGYIGMKVVVQP